MPRSAFGCILIVMWGTFLSAGVLIPLLPLYITDALGAGAGALGLTVLLYSAAGVMARPIAGTYLATRDPWRLLQVSAVVGVVVLMATPLVPEMAWVYALRTIEGLALSMIYLAGTTAVVRMTPAAHQGRALSYVSVPLFLGIALGPALGDLMIASWGYNWTWIGAGAVLAVATPAAFIGASYSKRQGLTQRGGEHAQVPMTRTDLWRTLAHPAALVPAGVIVLLVVGWATFQLYIPLYGPTIGLSATGTVFLVQSVVVLLIRIGGANLFDRMPLIELALVGAICSLVGLAIAWLWVAKAAVYLSAMLLGVAVGLSYTTLLRVALVGVSRAEQGSVIGAYSVAYDLGAGLGTAAVSVLVAYTSSYRLVFLCGAVCAVASIALVLTRLWSRRRDFWPPITPSESVASPG
jgi:predicted MFS family arabinose efflux permease